jgi:hypothetical protein
MKATKKPSRRRSLNAVIPLVVYPFDVVCSIGASEPEFRRLLKSNNIEYDESMNLKGCGKCIEMTENIIILRTYLPPKDPESHSTLAHEIFHVVDMALRTCGMKLTEHSHEAYAYLIGYLTEQIYKRL